MIKIPNLRVLWGTQFKSNLLVTAFKVISTWDQDSMKFLGFNQSSCRIVCLYLKIDVNKKKKHVPLSSTILYFKMCFIFTCITICIYHKIVIVLIIPLLKRDVEQSNISKHNTISLFLIFLVGLILESFIGIVGLNG